MIELTVIGSGFGETCIIAFEDETGRKRFGLVDGYTSEAPSPERNPLLRILRGMDGFEDRIEFLIITHPHLDHMNGLWQLLSVLGENVEMIGWWGGPDFHLQTAYFQRLADEARHEGLDLPGQAEQVYKLLTEVTRVRQRSGDRPEFETNVGVRQIYPIGRVGSDSGLKITAFSPCLSEASRFTSMVTDCVSPGRPVTVEHDWNNVNRTSLGLYLSWHDVRMVLGGDVESENWVAALPELPQRDYPPVHVFKVAHHGSPNGMAPGMWEPPGRWIRRDPQPTIAVVTPFSATRAPRPDPEVLGEMRDGGCQVLVAEPRHDGRRRVPGEVSIVLDRNARIREIRTNE